MKRKLSALLLIVLVVVMLGLSTMDSFASPPAQDPAQNPTPTPGILSTPVVSSDVGTLTDADRGGFLQAPIFNPNEPDTQSRLVRYPWWWIFFAIMLVLIIFFLIVHYLSARELWLWPVTVAKKCKPFCFLSRAALLLYLLLMTYAIGMLARELRDEHGKILWQIDAYSSRFAVFDDYSETLRDVPQINQDRCVGCHAYHEPSGRMAFVSDGLGGPISVWDGAESVETLGINGSYMAFSPDGRRLVYSRFDEDLYIYDFDTGTQYPVLGASEEAFIEVMPTWSPDGNTIVFARSETPLTGLENRLALATDLYSVPANVAEDAAVQADPVPGASEPGTFEYYPVYSPNGYFIAYTRHQNQTTYADPQAQLWVISAAGGTPNRISANNTTTGEATPGNSWAVWSQDSRWLAFGTQRQDITNDVLITRVNPDGSSGDVYTLQGAAQRGVMEDRAIWWSVPARASWADVLLDALPWLLPLLPLLLLIWLTCCNERVEETEEIDYPAVPPLRPAEPMQLPGGEGIAVLWEPQPALIIGLGTAGQHVLTQLKKNLLDAGLGEMHPQIALLCITTHNATTKSNTVRFAGVQLDDDEIIPWRDTLLDTIQAAAQDAALRAWSDPAYRWTADMVDPTTGFENHRVLGRVALIQNLRGNHDLTGVNVWQRLVTAAEQARDEHNRLRVIIVGRLDDDVSSGAFLDVAYLVRQLEARLGLQGVRLIGHLVTDRVRTDENDPIVRQINTVAALRELARFQLATNTPFIMHYSPDASQPHELGGVWQKNAPLFNELYVYDGESKTRNFNMQPQYSVYPIIADSIAMWLDTASAAAGLAAWRDSHLRATRAHQTTHKELTVGGLGLFQYRLPFYDLLEEITLNYARQVLHMLLMGPHSDEEPRLDAALAEERIIEEATHPDRLPPLFFQEKLGGAVELSQGWRLLLTALTQDDDVAVLRAMRLTRVDSDADQQAWRHWLQNTVLVLLNGSAAHTAEDPIITRGAKIGLALHFLTLLSSEGQTQGWLPTFIRRVEAVNHRHAEAIVPALRSFAAYTEQFCAQLYQQAVALGATSDPDSIYARLARRTAAVETHRADLRQIATREYIFQDGSGKDLSHIWYETYLSPNLKRGLEQLHWRIDETGKPVLHVRQPGDQPGASFDPTQPDMFEQALLMLARYFAEPVRHNTSLGQVLRDGVLAEENVQKTGQTLLDLCAALLGIAEAEAPGLDRSLIFSVNDSVTNAGRLGNYLDRTNTINEVLCLNTTDPFTLTLAQTADTVPLRAVTSVQNASMQYNRDEHAIRSASGVVIHPTAVFPNEANALLYERRLHELEIPRRILNPVLVSGLISNTKARVYLLAAVSGQELRKQADLQFSAPEWQAILLDQRQLSHPIHGWLVDGLLQFVQLIDEATARIILERYADDDSQFDQWDEWELDGGATWESLPDMPATLKNDLIAVTRLMIRDILEGNV